MADSRVLERIAAWESAGLIDSATAARLRTSEAAQVEEIVVAAPEMVIPRPSGTAALIGPPVSIIEVFAYLGGAFLVAAWHVLTQNLLPPSVDAEGNYQADVLQTVVEWIVPAIALGVGGWYLARSGPSQRRAAGVLFAVSVGHVFQGTATLLAPASDFRLHSLVAAIASTVAAGLFRRLHAAVLTQATLLGALVVLAATAVAWIDQQLFASVADPYTVSGGVQRVLLEIAWWLGWALLFGLFGRWELRGARDDVEANRRAFLSRFVGGFTAVIGTTVGISANGETGRLLEPWLGDLLLLVVVAVLLAAAFRFGASVYLAPAALGIVIALSDLNEYYLAQQTGQGVALLLEGVILIGVGFGGDRLRKRLASRQTPPMAAPPLEPAPEPA
jgi:hypothetical protein